jgi:hypothetical protein
MYLFRSIFNHWWACGDPWLSILDQLNILRVLVLKSIELFTLFLKVVERWTILASLYI